MTWFNVDDSFYDHPKVFDAPDSAVALWTRAGSWSARNLTDGFVPAAMTARLCDDHDAAVRELIDRGLWRRAKGGYLFHDWSDWNLSREVVKAKRAFNARRQALARDPGLKEAVRQRDGDSCRYCGQVVRWGRGQAPDSGTYDHVDPAGGNTLENLVVACRGCNSVKSGRTPGQAGMPLLPPRSNGYGNAPRNASPNGSVQASVQALQSNPIQSLSEVINQVSGANALVDEDLILKTIIDSIHERTGSVVGAAHARTVGAMLLSGRTPNDPAAYVRKAILREPNPGPRFLPSEPSRSPPSCGQCSPTRRIEDDDGNDLGPCPTCHPSMTNGKRS